MTRRVVALLLVLSAQRLAVAQPVTEIHYVMGTYFRIAVERSDPQTTRQAMHWCFQRTRQLEAAFSRFDSKSELTRINSTSSSTTMVSDEMAALLQASSALGAATDGAFDVAAGALTALWRDADYWPDRSAIAAAKSSAGRAAFTLNGRSLQRRSGVRIDLDGIAKGYAVDLCVEHLRRNGIESALLSFGESSLFALGHPRDSRAWEIEVRGLDSNNVLGTLRMHDQALSASAVFGHEHQIGTRRVGHIVDPRTGRPLMKPALAIVVMPSATAAEAWSKAVLVNGDLRRFADRNREAGALLVRPNRFEQVGGIDLIRVTDARPISADEEPLR